MICNLKEIDNDCALWWPVCEFSLLFNLICNAIGGPLLHYAGATKNLNTAEKIP